MRTLESLSDRLLSVFAPRATAEATICCPVFFYSLGCSCTGGYLYQKTCQSNCCHTFCGVCYKTSTTC